MIEYGSDYLLGLATLAAEKFGQRDRLWESGDAAYYEVSDALQYLGNVVFRNPAQLISTVRRFSCRWPVAYPAIEHIPANPQRPQWEREILRDCLRRLFPDKDESQLNGAGSIQKELGDKVSSR